MADGPTVRRARLEDIPTILRFIKAAAADQGMAGSVKATEETYAATLHLDSPQPTNSSDSPSRFAWALLIVSPTDEVAGLAIYYYNYSTWRSEPGLHLEELFVLPEYRRRGYARVLMEALAREALKANCTRMEWVCFKDNSRALKFYDKLGAKKLENCWTLRVERQSIEELSAGIDEVP